MHIGKYAIFLSREENNIDSSIVSKAAIDLGLDMDVFFADLQSQQISHNIQCTNEYLYQRLIARQQL